MALERTLSCSAELARAAARARHALSAHGINDINRFIASRQADDGGFKGRGQSSDLYYTLFAVGSLAALRSDVPSGALSRYLESFGDGRGLGFVDMLCLLRLRARLATAIDIPCWAERLQGYRTADGGFHRDPKMHTATVYDTFLGALTYSDLGWPLPAADAAADAVAACRRQDGAYANHPGDRGMTVPVTAAAAVLLHCLGRPVPPKTVAWLRGCFLAPGGCRAAAEAPAPDLLSTAVALHALASVEPTAAPPAAATRAFVTSLWDEAGGFCGSWHDPEPDCEYTFYALLALGHTEFPAGPDNHPGHAGAAPGADR